MSFIDSAVTSLSSVTKVVSTATGLFTGLAGPNKMQWNRKLPLPNDLSDYATFTYVLSLGVLTTNELNNPDTTYMAGKRIPLICKTAGADPNNRINTPYGKFDFFIENLSLDFALGFFLNKNVNMFTAEFDIIEPYSMGMFMVALQEAAQAAGYLNWREVPLLLTIEFQGNQQTGVPMLDIPGTTRYLPLKLSEMSMNTSDKGTRYHFTAYSHNAGALTEESASLKSDVSVKGKTVQEVLQTGEKSLQAVVNARLRQLKDDGIVEVPDEVLILFPVDAASSTAAGANKAESTATATLNTKGSGADLYKKLGVERSESTKNLVQSEGQCNALGRASMGYDLRKKADHPMGKDNAVYDSKRQVWDQSKNTFDVKEGNLKFTQDIDIPTAINQVLLASDYPTYALSNDAVDEEGMRPFWKIDTQVYDIETDSNYKTTGTRPRLIVYRVIEYGAHTSHLAAPNTKAPGIDQLKNNAVKYYDYIYTGKNTEVLKFDIDFNYGFNSVLPADKGKRSPDLQLLAKLSGGFGLGDLLGTIFGGILGDVAGAAASIFAGSSPSKDSGVIPTQTKYVGTKTSTDGLGGGGLETASNNAARYYFDAYTYGYNMQVLEMDILGDPYWIAQSGQGNYTATQTQYKNLNADGTVNYQNGEVTIMVNFRTPIDINQATGMYDFGTGSSAPVPHFSGLYVVTVAKSMFSNGRFTQRLTGYRVPQQENKKEGTLDQLFNIGSIVDKIGSAISGIFK